MVECHAIACLHGGRASREPYLGKFLKTQAARVVSASGGRQVFGHQRAEDINDEQIVFDSKVCEATCATTTTGDEAMEQMQMEDRVLGEEAGAWQAPQPR